MGFSEAVRTCFSKYATFVGRAPRSEYWFFWLFSLLASVVGGMIDGAVGTLGIIGLLIELVLFLPSLAVSVRRLHDIDRTGWWILLPFVLIIGSWAMLVSLLAGTAGLSEIEALNPTLLNAVGLVSLVGLVLLIVLLVWFCTRGTVGPNRFGPDPLAGAIGTAAA